MPIDPAARAGGILTIDLAAIQGNYRRLQKKLGGTACAAVVKADAYGLGASEVGPALWTAGARRFFVAMPDEGIRLRRSLPDAEIYILGGLFEDAEEAYFGHDLRPVLNSLREVRLWADFRRRRQSRLAAALQIDSGMNRLGLPKEEVTALQQAEDILQNLDLCFVMSHLASADEAGNVQNQEQLTRFRTSLDHFPKLAASLANSSGIFLGAAYHFDLARPGAALYGINPTPGQANPMQPVVQLQARVLQVRNIQPGDRVGYGGRFQAEKPGRIATVAVGYADGFLRYLSDRGSAWFQGTRLPLAGLVSMDVAGVDVTGLPPDRLKPGDLVELLGPNQGVDDLAAQAGTIGYEILTALGRRYHRVYRGA